MFLHPVNVLEVNFSIFHLLYKQSDWGMKSSRHSSFSASQEDTQSIKWPLDLVEKLANPI